MVWKSNLSDQDQELIEEFGVSGAQTYQSGQNVNLPGGGAI